MSYLFMRIQSHPYNLIKCTYEILSSEYKAALSELQIHLVIPTTQIHYCNEKNQNLAIDSIGTQQQKLTIFIMPRIWNAFRFFMHIVYVVCAPFSLGFFFITVRFDAFASCLFVCLSEFNSYVKIFCYI